MYFYNCPFFPYQYRFAVTDEDIIEQQSAPIQQEEMIIAEVTDYTYPANFPGALKLIQDAVAGEREDELFYTYLISIAPTEEAKNIIISIRNDERKHNRLLRGIYFQLIGRRLRPSPTIGFERPASYCAGIKKALFRELSAVQSYRKILFALQDRVHINMLTEIITDELRHADLYNLLYSDAKCFNSESRF